MVEPLRHRQTKEAETDMSDLQPPRHISTLPLSTFVATQHFGSHRSISGHAADIEPTLMTQRGSRVCIAAIGIMFDGCSGRLGEVTTPELCSMSFFGTMLRHQSPLVATSREAKRPLAATHSCSLA